MLRGENVILRAFQREDLERLVEFDNDPHFVGLISENPWEPVSFARLEAHFENRLEQGEKDGPIFAIEADGQYIGHCLLHQIDQTSRTCQIGIGIGDASYRGRGFGREALQLLLGYAFQIRNMRKVWLSVVGNNEAAIRSYVACGFVEEGRLKEQAWLEGSYDDLVYMGLFQRDWEAAQG